MNESREGLLPPARGLRTPDDVPSLWVPWSRGGAESLRDEGVDPALSNAGFENEQPVRGLLLGLARTCRLRPPGYTQNTADIAINPTKTTSRIETSRRKMPFQVCGLL